MKVSISSYLAEIAGATELDFEIETKMPLEDFFKTRLFTEYPALQHRIVDENGEIRRHVAIFVGDTHIKFLKAKSTEIFPDDEVFILPAVSGG